jgi:hypothetical protein
MAIKKNKFSVEQEYNKQLKRVKSFIRRAEKKGFVFSENVVPSRPKRITQASVRKLEKLTPNKLYQKAEYVSKATYGEVISGKKGLQIVKQQQKEQRKAKQKQRNIQVETPTQESTNTEGFTPPTYVSYDTSFFTRVVISNYREYLTHFNEMCREILTDWLDRQIAQNGELAVAVMLEDGAKAGYLVTYKIAYDRDKILDYISHMMEFMSDTDDIRARVMEAFEQDEDNEIPF